LLDRVAAPVDWEFGPSSLGRWGRRALAALAVAFGLAVIITGLVGIASGTHGGTRQTARPPAAASSEPGAPAVPPLGGAAVRSSPGAGLAWHTPLTVVPAGTPLQEQYDQAFSQGLSSLSGMSAAETLTVASAAIVGGWPRLSVEVTPERWAQAFTVGLLDVDYASQSRPGLAAWLQAQEAPELIPGVPASVADKILSISLLAPGLFGGQPTPVASTSQWDANAQAGVRQSVSNLIVQADPGWAQMTAAGWQPTDVRMTEEDVSGLLTMRTDRGVASHRFVLQLIVGSARWHDGYGTVAATGWREQ
jgi:hypothetical protein